MAEPNPSIGVVSIDEDAGVEVGSDDQALVPTGVLRIGWMPAYDIAYVKHLEYDRENLTNKDIRNEEMVKHYKFQMES